MNLGKNELKENLYKNTIVTLIVQLVRMLLQFALQKVFIETLGMEYLGYNSVFKNILQMLNMADLGIGVAITGFLYKPLAEGDEERVSALMYVYKQVYHIIGFAIIALGAIITTILPVIIPDAQCSYYYLRVLFIINLLGTISTYFLAYRRTLLIADQKSYYTNAIDMFLDLLGTILQIIILFIVPNYIIYLVLNVGKNVFANVIISYNSSKKYNKYLKKPKSEIVYEYKEPIKKYVGDVFISKIGGYVFSGTDNLIISICKGSLLAGYLSNYTLASFGIKAIITQVLSAVQATYGKYIVTVTSNSKQCNMTDNYIYIDYLIGNICMVCCVVLFQPFVKIFYGTKYVLAFSTAVLIAVNLGLAILLIIPTQIFVVYKLYKYDKYVVCFSAFLNIVISVVLVIVIGVNGVLIGTTITSLVYLFSRLYIIATRVFDIGYSHYIMKLLKYSFVSVISLGIALLVGRDFVISSWGELITYAVMIAGVSIVISVICTAKMKESIFFIEKIFPFGKKVFWGLIAGVLVGVIGAFVLLHNKADSSTVDINEDILFMESDKVVILPNIDDESQENIGFTCTGLAYDDDRGVFYIGKYGKMRSNEPYGESAIVVMNENFTEIVDMIYLGEIIQNDDIQGVAYDSEDQSIWFTDGKSIYEIDADKKTYIRTIELKGYAKPNGLAYDKKTDTLYCLLFKDFLLQIQKDGTVIKEISCNYKSQDHLGFDENGVLYFTVGADYYGTDNFIYVLTENGIEPRYQLLDSYAIEGLIIGGGYLIVANDGLYHEAKIPLNQINFYKID